MEVRAEKTTIMTDNLKEDTIGLETIFFSFAVDVTKLGIVLGLNLQEITSRIKDVLKCNSIHLGVSF